MTPHTSRLIKSGFIKSLIYVLIGIITVLFSFPFIWMLSTSLKTTKEMFRPIPTIIPSIPTFENYRYLWTQTIFPRALWNSFFVAVCTTVLVLLFSVFLAYGLTRFHFKGKILISNLLLLTQMFPLSLITIVIFVVFANLGLIDSYPALILSHCTFAMPFATIMLKSFFLDLPLELEEAAAIDGCSPISTIFKVVLPLSGPSIAAIGIFSFILSWQEYMMSMTLIRSEAMRTVPVMISMMIGFMEVQWGPLMAATATITFPVVVVFTYFQKYMISGMTLGAVKE